MTSPDVPSPKPDFNPKSYPSPEPLVQAVVVFMHGTWVSPEVYGLQLDRLAAGGVLVLAPCGVEGLSGFAQFFNPDMKKFQAAYQAREMPSVWVAVKG